MASVQEIKNQVTTRLKEIAAEMRTLEQERTALTKVADTLGASTSAQPARNGRRRNTRRRTTAARTSSPRASAARTTPARAASGRTARATRATATTASTTSATRGRGRASTRRAASGGSGKRAEQTVRIIAQNPGVTVKEIAAKLGIKPNYLYRVLPTLEKDGKVSKKGTGYVPTKAS